MKQFFLNNNEIENVFRSKPLQYESKYTIDELIQRTFELNKITKTIDKDNSIAIVGNSGKLMNESYGELIDSYDFVFRCNLAQTNGYEKHVGSKTDFRFIAGKSFWRDLSEHFSGYDNDFLTNLIDEHFIIKAEPLYPAIQGVIKNFKTKSNILYLKQHLVDDIENNLNISDPSTGFVAIMMALQWCKNISIFGFGFFEEDWSNQHYFENIKPYVRGHNPLNEKNYIEQLVKNKYLKIY
tara:strand:+ start:745 stop:1461 length:717 start_codon:yes stop_codon:yes gene_type:complete